MAKGRDKMKVSATLLNARLSLEGWGYPTPLQLISPPGFVQI